MMKVAQQLAPRGGRHEAAATQLSRRGFNPSSLRVRSNRTARTAIQFSVMHTLGGYYILIIARFVKGCAVFEGVLARLALGAIL